jgi:hypothetical protein
MRRRIKRGMKFWPKQEQPLTTTKVVEMYGQGFAGAYEDDDSRDELEEVLSRTSKFKNADDLVHSQNYAEKGRGELTLLFPAVTDLFGYEALTWPGQKTGDCVSMMGRDAGLFTTCIDVKSGTPDEVTGMVEGLPEVSDIARRNGVFANEPGYKYRGHNGQGMNCDQIAKWHMTVGGVIVRKKYPEVDLESYNVQFSLKGSSGVPDWLKEEGKKHQIRSGLRVKSHEEVRDLMAVTKAYIGTCSSLGFSSQRDANGFSQRKGSWGHSWHIAGYDDRPWAHQTYGHALALFGHRWAKWNKGPRRIHGTTIDIPEGYCWIDARLLNQCWLMAFNSVTGWPAKTLPPVRLLLG